MKEENFTHICHDVIRVRGQIDHMIWVKFLRQIEKIQLMLVEKPPVGAHFGAFCLYLPPEPSQMEGQGLVGAFHKGLRLVELLGQRFDFVLAHEVLETFEFCIFWFFKEERGIRYLRSMTTLTPFFMPYLARSRATSGGKSFINLFFLYLFGSGP